MIIASITGFVALSFTALVLKELSDRRNSRKKSIHIDLEHLKDGEEIVWVGNYPYIVGGSK